MMPQIKPVDYTIEYSHIYMDEAFTDKHRRSIPLLHQVENELKKRDLSYNRTIMVDDYNPVKYKLNLEGFFKELKELEAFPDTLLMESEMVYWVNDLLEKASGRIKKSYVRYINKKGHYPCSLLLTVSHLVKLGYYEHPFGGSSYLSKVPSGKRTIVILPEEYANVEKQGIQLLHSAGLEEYIKKIEHIFYK
jgi:hypothetical protein